MLIRFTDRNPFVPSSSSIDCACKCAQPLSELYKNQPIGNQVGDKLLLCEVSGERGRRVMLRTTTQERNPRRLDLPAFPDPGQCQRWLGTWEADWHYADGLQGKAVAAVLMPSPEDHSTSVVSADVAGEARTFTRIASSCS
jgi:hypothetical protein